MNTAQAPEQQATEQKTPFWKRRWFWIVVGAVLVLGVISNLLGGGNSDTPETEQTSAAEQIATPTEDEAEEPEPAPEPAVRPVAEAEAAWLAEHGVNSPLDFITMEGYENDANNPLYAIQTGWSGSTNGYLEIKVQEPLNDESVKRLGINVLNFIGPEFPDIDGIVFTDSNGLDHNFYRHDAPLADKT